jgi:hypothetical protein
LKHIKTYLLIVLATVVGSYAHAQNHEIGAWVGASNYFGDLNTRFSWWHAHPAGGLFYRYNLGTRFAVKGTVSYGQVEGNDATSGSAAQRQRNLSFQSYLIDITGMIEFNFLHYDKTRPRKHGFTPYIGTGFGIFFFNPEAQYRGKTYFLQPLGTEGQNDPSYSGVDKYKLYSFHIPIEGGFKFHIQYNWNLTVFASVHKTFTDYLDDVSGVYPTAPSLPSGSKGLAAALSDRSAEILGAEKIGKPGYQRGYSSKNDDFVFVGIAVSYTFMSLRCPSTSGNWTYR